MLEMIKNRLTWRMSLKTKKALFGYIFVGPFLLGFFLFFLYPFIQSVLYSLSSLEMGPQGVELEYTGFRNYNHILFVHAEFVRTFAESIFLTLLDIPAILGFSFFAAVLLNQKFRGRTMARAVFFLPVILTAGVLIRIRQVDYLADAMGEGGMMVEGGGGGFFAGHAIQMFLLEMRFPEVFIEYILAIAERIPELINASAIPIIIFLAGLQSLPNSLYEASRIEGATAWEHFWKITFPLMSPLILTNLVYIVIDTFTSPQNPLVILIENTMWGGGSRGYGYAAAMSWSYFIAIVFILSIAIGIISRRVVYMD